MPVAPPVDANSFECTISASATVATSSTATPEMSQMVARSPRVGSIRSNAWNGMTARTPITSCSYR